MDDKLCTIIVTYDNKNMLSDLLGQIQSISDWDNIDSLLVVVNPSDDGTESYLLDIGIEKINYIVLDRNRGGAGGFIAGVEWARNNGFDLCWLMDDDTYPLQGSLNSLLEAKTKLPKWGAIGSSALFHDNSTTINEAGSGFNWITCRFKSLNNGVNAKSLESTPYSVGSCAANSMLISMEAVNEIGFFEDRFIFFDDVEWCYRLSENGWGVYCAPESQVLHGSVNGKEISAISRYYNVLNMLWFYNKVKPNFLVFLRIKLILMKLNYFFRNKKELIHAVKLACFDHGLGKISFPEEIREAV